MRTVKSKNLPKKHDPLLRRCTCYPVAFIRDPFFAHCGQHLPDSLAYVTAINKFEFLSQGWVKGENEGKARQLLNFL